MIPNAKLRLGSRVSFMANQVQPQDAVPPDLSHESFEDRETLEKYPLRDNQLAIVISAYDKTIGMSPSLFFFFASSPFDQDE